MRSTHWLRCWHRFIRTSALSAMRTRVFMHGVVRIFRISWTLKRIIPVALPLSWNRITVLQRRFCRLLTPLSIITKTVRRRCCGPIRTQALKSVISQRSPNEKSRRLSAKLLASVIRWTIFLMATWRFCIVPTLSPVCSKKGSSRWAFRTPWLEARSSTTARKLKTYWRTCACSLTPLTT